MQKKDGNESYTCTYDKRGNRVAETGKKESRSYIYDETNRMVEGTNWKGDKSAYTYNGLGLRINNIHTTHAGKAYARDYVIDYTSFENDDLMVYAEGNGQLEYEQKHVYAGSERIEQFTDKGNWERTLYVHEDVMGNTRYYTKGNGQSYAELTYDAWGMPESPNKLLNNDHGNYVFATFTGHIYDTTLDIYFAEARFYDANNRTWLATDPVKDGLNWYQYCYSNPTTYYDPLGLWGSTTGSKQATLSGSNTSTGTSSYIWGLIASIGGNIGEAYLFPYALILEATTGVHALSLVNSGRQGTEDWIRKNFSTSDRSFYQGALAGDEIVQIFGKLVVVQGGLQALGGISVAFGAGGATIGSGGALALPGGIAIAVDAVVVAQGVQTAVAGGILYSVGSKSSSDHQGKLQETDIPDYQKENRVPLDKETVLSGSEYQKTGKRVKGAQVYKKGDRYYYRDTFHTGESAHLEVFDKRGNHLGEADPITGILRPGTVDPSKSINVQ